MAVSFMTLWSLWAFLLLVLFLKSAFEHQARILNRVISKIFCILPISLVWDFFHLGYQIYLREIPENAKMNNLQNFVYELVELRLFTELPT